MNADEGLRRIGVAVSIGLGALALIVGIGMHIEDPEQVPIWGLLLLTIGWLVVPWVFFSLLRWIIRGFQGKE